MASLLAVLFALVALNAISCEMVWVEGGRLPKESELNDSEVASFQIARCETSWAEWRSVRRWATDHGYDLDSVGTGAGEHHPVVHVSWHDVIKWCNARSEREGLAPVFDVAGKIYRREGQEPNRPTKVTMRSEANGYRLPLESEWEWAARGGVMSNQSTFSGGNDLNAVGWYRGNCLPNYEHFGGIGTQPIAIKRPNELGLYDMSGNVWEWCWDSYSLIHPMDRRVRGGCWFTGESVAKVAYRDSGLSSDVRFGNCGFRVARRAS
jgi:sulfatase modifying factor 1